MHQYHKSLLSILTFLACILPNINAAYALSINNIRLGAHPEKIRMVLDLSETADFRVFTLSDPYRMVIDLPTFSWNAGKLQTPEATQIIAVRQGNLKQGVSRIVFDLHTPVSVRSAFLLPKQGGKSNRLVIDYNKISAAQFEATKGNIHGSLMSDSANAPVTAHVTQKPTQTTPAQKPIYNKPLVVIDPGHGGNDPGSIGKRKNKEKDIVLALARQLKSKLEASGKYKVLLTRNKDKYIRLRDRVSFARKKQADLFISLHADSIGKSSVRGTSVYTLSEKASDSQTAKLAAKENRSDIIAGVDLSIEDEDVANILVDLAMRDTMNQSTFVANTLVKKFRNKNLRTLENPHRFAGFAVLKAPDVPSILIEAGFMSNRSEEKLLSSHSYRKKIADAIADGVDAYFKHVELNNQL